MQPPSGQIKANLDSLAQLLPKDKIFFDEILKFLLQTLPNPDWQSL